MSLSVDVYRHQNSAAPANEQGAASGARRSRLDRAACRTLSHRLVRDAGFQRFADLKRLVIDRGFRREDGRPVDEFRRLERLFHSAQMLRWAAADRLQRTYWWRLVQGRHPDLTSGPGVVGTMPDVGDAQATA
jgi:hypothetical protein